MSSGSVHQPRSCLPWGASCLAAHETSSVTVAGQQIGSMPDVGSHCVTATNEVAWQSMSVSSVKRGSSESTTRNMEETGVLEKVNLSGFCYLALNQVEKRNKP